MEKGFYSISDYLDYVDSIEPGHRQDNSTTFHLWKREIKNYNADITNKPQVIAANKVDMLSEDDEELIMKKLRDKYEPLGVKVFATSTLTGKGINELLYYVSRTLDNIKEGPVIFEQEFFPETMERTSDEAYSVIYDEAEKEYVVEGPKIEKMLGITNLYAPENIEQSHCFTAALRAKALMKRDRDYVVRDDEVIIVDEFTGRLMLGRRYSEGLHQAIEAKEHVDVQKENKTLATITFQNYFRLYDKLAGMTGTAETEAHLVAQTFCRSAFSAEILTDAYANRTLIQLEREDLRLLAPAAREQVHVRTDADVFCDTQGWSIISTGVSLRGDTAAEATLLRRDEAGHYSALRQTMRFEAPEEGNVLSVLPEALSVTPTAEGLHLRLPLFGYKRHLIVIRISRFV